MSESVVSIIPVLRVMRKAVDHEKFNSLIIIIITKFISYCRPLGLWTTSGPGQDPGLDKQLQCNKSKEAKYMY